jgi:hypothetical protein
MVVARTDDGSIYGDGVEQLSGERIAVDAELDEVARGRRGCCSSCPPDPSAAA